VGRGVSDSRAQQAREHHRAAEAALELAERHRQQRNALVRRLRESDPQRWSYKALAAAVGCSPELVAAIVKNRV
jgi:AraC-like DNA-binding protein